MTSSLTINTTLVNDHWNISGSLSPGGLLPIEIFRYTNTGSTALGEYTGICNLEEISRLSIFSGVALPIFGNKFVRYGSFNIVVPISADTLSITSTIIANVTTLSAAYKTKTNSTQVVIIP